MTKIEVGICASAGVSKRRLQWGLRRSECVRLVWASEELNNACTYVFLYGCECVCLNAYTRSVGGVSRVSHGKITLNPSVIKESNCTMESEDRLVELKK